ncbi:MAG: Omp28-related outer membrane protein [Saprospiraceae bacterium]|nr:Omp28-related outer membrane protein [Saprospiraceae bacterium]MBK7810271.1 Omp28-related outer membrane protein [Saprospiraceae bacterium]MBK9629874.1 Omp28-related outer membrane protein [Saprospiraceae bacterium]
MIHISIKKYFLPISFLFILIAACSDWEQPVVLPNQGGIQSSRVLLVEEFTGASCTNCPAGNAELVSIIDKYPNNVVVVGVHSNFLGNPAVAGEPDLRTKDAMDIETFLGTWFGKPEAAFNRRKFPNKSNIRVNRPDTWITFVEEELINAHIADLKLNITYDSLSRKVNITLVATALENINKPLFAHALITESEIFVTQLDLTGKIPNYRHEHVLRKLLTQVGGEKIADSLAKGQSASKSFEYTLPDENVLWVAKHCSAVGFISYDSSEKYVLQAAEGKIVK